MYREHPSTVLCEHMVTLVIPLVELFAMAMMDVQRRSVALSSHWHPFSAHEEHVVYAEHRSTGAGEGGGEG